MSKPRQDIPIQIDNLRDTHGTAHTTEQIGATRRSSSACMCRRRREVRQGYRALQQVTRKRTPRRLCGTATIRTDDVVSMERSDAFTSGREDRSRKERGCLVTAYTEGKEDGGCAQHLRMI